MFYLSEEKGKDNGFHKVLRPDPRSIFYKKSTINLYSNIDKNRTTTFPEMELAVVLGTKVMTCT